MSWKKLAIPEKLSEKFTFSKKNNYHQNRPHMMCLPWLIVGILYKTNLPVKPYKDNTFI